MTDNPNVNHPQHYTWLKDVAGCEVIDITRHLDFDLGNAVKYILRAGRKAEQGKTDAEKRREDIEKAVFYLQDYLNHVLKEKAEKPRLMDEKFLQDLLAYKAKKPAGNKADFPTFQGIHP